MTTLPRAATSPELVKLRSGNQSSRFYATFHQPATVYSARLVGPPTSNDNVSSITYNTGSGSYTDILTDMRVDIGTTAGAYDLGTTRVHDLSGLGATSGELHIERTSEIDWLSNGNAYITILDAFDLRARPPYADSSGTLFMDTNIAYSDQHTKCKSTPIFPRYSVRWLPVGGGTITVVKDGTQSWALNNTITNYAWTCPGASAVSGSSTNTVTISYNAANAHAGYRVQLDLTNSDNVDSTGYGRVFVLGSVSDAYEITMPVTVQGNYQSGGWSAQITMYFDADRTTIRDRAMVILHRRDWYGLTTADEGSLGYISGDENIELVGWIAGESIKWLRDDMADYVQFTIHGPQYWLDHLTMPPVGLKNISSHPPTNWKRFTGLTAKSMTWHILHWRTTAPVMMDCFAANSTVGALQFQSSGAQTVWQQLSNVLNDFIIAKPCCDSYARLFMQTEQNLLSASDRSSIPTVMTVTKDDWSNEIDFDRKILNNVAGVDLNGEIYDGTNTTEVYALCPGRTFGSSGTSIYQRTRLAILDQASLNTLAGAAYGWKNPLYPNWRFVLASNMHLIDLAPYQYLGISIAAGDTVRGFTASGLRLIPRDIKRTFADGIVTPEVSIEAESSIGIGIIGDTPPAPPNPPTNPPPLPPQPPPPVPVPSGNAREVWFATTTAIYWSGDYFLGGQPTWNQVTTVPAGTISQFSIARDGTMAYMVSSVGGANTIWATATPKTPVWSSVMSFGDSAAGSTINGYQGFIRLQGTTLYTVVHLSANASAWAYGAYNGSAWTWVRTPDISTFTDDGACPQTYSLGRFARDNANALLHDYSSSTYVFGPYRSPAGTRYIANFTGGHLYISNIVAGTNLADTGTTATNQSAIDTHIEGAETGNQIYCVSAATGAAGHLWLSDDGSTFADVATWDRGWVKDALLSGGGSLVWVLSPISGSAVPTRLYNRDGSVLRDMTGNFWSLTSGSQNVIGMGLVY